MNKNHSILCLVCLICVSVFLGIACAADTAPKVVPPVLSLREFELRPGVKAEKFEKFVCQEMASVAKDAAGMKMRILKGDRGARKGRYMLVWEFDSVASRNVYFPREGGFASDTFREAWKKMSAVMDKFKSYVKEPSDYTDYVVVSD